MSIPSGQRGRPATTGTKRHILEAAVGLIAEQGFTATSVDEIAEVAGVAKGSVYYNFGSKTDLFTDILTEGIGRLTTGLRASLAREPGRPALECLVGELLRQIRDHPAFAKVIASEVFRTGRDWQSSIRLLHDEAVSVFAEGVLAASPGTTARDASIMGSAVFGATLVAGLEWLAFQPDRSLEDVVPVLLRTVTARQG
ncbi:TetR/AcrR family transcriptional regulator [Actinotalea sp.]|uniref:TetR/AcrR family transcriptional regulator n=1 Tax=Actinotalea sp. TaxID=1872145 RepID=UPI003562DB34